MAFDNIEVEIKAQISQNDFLQTEKLLEKIASYKGTTQQLDIYYSPKENEGYLGNEQYPYKWFSIRQRGGKVKLNYKFYFPEKAEKHTHCNEYETDVSSLEMTEKIFSELGIIKIASVSKSRKTYEYLDEFEVVLDEVENLGFFIEIEAIKNQDGIENTRKKIENFFSELGIKEFRMDYRGYPFLIFEKQLSNNEETSN